MTKTDMVLEFHKKFGFSINVPLEENDILKKRLAFINEEIREFREAVTTGNRAEILKELCDVLYMLIGFGVCYGLPVDEGFKRAHASNMSKSPTDDPDGKAIKGPGYFKADLRDLFPDTNGIDHPPIGRGQNAA